MHLKKKQLYQYFLIFKIAVLIVLCFLPPVHPHVVRQVDTMAISLRFALRWFTESAPIYPYLPAYLGDADFYAIQFMEFPFINWVLAPFFAFGIEAGRFLNNFGLMGLNLGLTYWGYRKWKGKFVRSVKADDAFLLIPLLSASGLYFSKQVPDFTASALILVALGYSWDEKNRNFFISFLLLALGALIKPPQVVALAPLLLHPNRKYIIKSIFHWIIPAAIPCALYYTLGSSWILSLSDAGNHFGTHIRNPLESLLQFLMSPKKILILVSDVFVGRFLLVPMLFFVAWGLWREKLRRRMPALILLICLQTLGLALLDGDHLFIHKYYFCGISFTIALLYIKFTARAPRYLHYLAFSILVINFIDRAIYELNPLWKTNIYSECSDLKVSQPDFPWEKSYPFRSATREVPSLGLCFGEREGSKKSEYGFYYKTEQIPLACKVIDESKSISLVKCTL